MCVVSVHIRFVSFSLNVATLIIMWKASKRILEEEIPPIVSRNTALDAQALCSNVIDRREAVGKWSPRQIRARSRNDARRVERCTGQG